MQRNCHEFIAYENLVGSTSQRRRPRPPAGPRRQAARGGTSQVAAALPLVLRALKVLSEREVTPQLGLLKSTLLQLDSTFSERNYGAGQLPRLHGEGGADRRRRAEARRPQHAGRGGGGQRGCGRGGRWPRGAAPQSAGVGRTWLAGRAIGPRRCRPTSEADTDDEDEAHAGCRR